MDVKSSQVTGNAALHYAAWQLSRRGWNVLMTARNSKGSDLYGVSTRFAENRTLRSNEA